MTKYRTLLVLILLPTLTGAAVTPYCHLASTYRCYCYESSTNLVRTALNFTCSSSTGYTLTTIRKFPDPTTSLTFKNTGLTAVKVGDLNYLRGLKELDLADNRIATIEDGAFDGLMSLTRIDLMDNNLTTISENTFRNLSALQEMDLTNNRIATIEDGAFDGLMSLTHIDLMNNNLTTISENAFRNLPALQGINLANNRIATIENGAFDGLMSLTRIDLMDNNLTTISENTFRNLSALQEMGLANNRIATIENGAFDGLMSLTHIDLMDNNLTTISENTFRNLSALQEMDLTNNRIATIENGAFDGLMSLTRINLMHNNLTTISENTFRNLPALQEIYLAYNRIATIEDGTFDGFMSLIFIHLMNNSLTTISENTFRHLPALKELYLTNNRIATIEDGAFDGLMSLTRIYLMYNSLTTISENTFRHLPALKELGLANNQIKNVNRYAFLTVPGPLYVNLKSNPLRCMCGESRLREFVDAYNVVLQEARCSNLNNRLLTEVSMSDFPSCPQGDALFPRSVQCYACGSAAGWYECGLQTVATCTYPKSVCYSRVNYNGDVLVVSGSCMDYGTCIAHERNNYNACKKTVQGTRLAATCIFCGREALSNSYEPVKVTKRFTFRLVIQLDTVMMPGLKNTQSLEYKNFVRNLGVEVNNNLWGQKGGYVVEFDKLSSPQISMHFRVNATTIWFNTQTTVTDAMKSKLMTTQIHGYRAVKVTIDTSDGYCVDEVIDDPNYGQFKWPKGDKVTTVTIPCPFGTTSVRSMATRYCDYAAMWQTPNVAACVALDDEVSRGLATLAGANINDGNVVDVSQSASELTSNWTVLDEADVAWIADIVGGIVTTGPAKSSEKVISHSLDIVNNVLKIPADVLNKGQQKYKSSERILTSVDNLFGQIDVSGSDFKEVKGNIAGVVVPSVKGEDFNGLTMAVTSATDQTYSEGDITYTKDAAGSQEDKSSIVLPASLFAGLSNRKRKSVDKIAMSTVRNDKLFYTNNAEPVTREIVLADNTTVNASRTINSHVISASVPNVDISNLKTPVIVRFQHFGLGVNAACVYWDVARQTWSSDGCDVMQTNDRFTECNCTHLTNFALLMDVYGTGGLLSESDRMALAIISYLGCAVSLVAVIATLITYVMFKKLRRDNPSKILMNLCLAIGLVDVVFLAGMQGYASSSDAGCKLVAMLLHYCLLVVMCWMLVEAFYMYMALIKVFDTYIARFQLKSSLFGWGVPLIIVVVTIAVNGTGNYGTQPGGICWLNRLAFYLAFLLPVCLVLVINIVMYIIVIRKILGRTSQKLTKADKSSTTVRLRGALSLVALLGITWIFAIFAIGDYGVAFHYLFALFNTLQGLFICIFYCILKTEAQQSWKKTLPCCRKAKYAQDTTTNSKGYSTSETEKSRNTVTKDSDIAHGGAGDNELSVTNSLLPCIAVKDEGTLNVIDKPATAYRGRWQLSTATGSFEGPSAKHEVL